MVPKISFDLEASLFIPPENCHNRYDKMEIWNFKVWEEISFLANFILVIFNIK